MLPGIYPHKNLHMYVLSSFIHNCQNLETTKTSFSRWMDKLWCMRTMEYYSALKRNVIKPWKNMEEA